MYICIALIVNAIIKINTVCLKCPNLFLCLHKNELSMKFSKYVQECINIHHLTPQTVAFAHLVALCNFTEQDAAAIAFPSCLTLSSTAVNNFCINLHKQAPGIRDFIEDLKEQECKKMKEYAKNKEKRNEGKDAEKRIKLNNYKQYENKQGIIEALTSLVEELNGKEKADVLMKIADLKQFRKEQDEKTCKTVHFYLPVR